MRQNRKLLFILISIAFVISLILFLIALSLKPAVLDKKEIPLKLQIGNRTGFDVSKTELNFGLLSSGNSASRSDVLVKNNYNFSIQLDVNIEGNISSFLIYDNLICLNPGEERNLEFSTVIITNEPYGNYSGKMIILIKKSLSQ